MDKRTTKNLQRIEWSFSLLVSLMIPPQSVEKKHVKTLLTNTFTLFQCESVGECIGDHAVVGHPTALGTQGPHAPASDIVLEQYGDSGRPLILESGEQIRF